MFKRVNKKVVAASWPGACGRTDNSWCVFCDNGEDLCASCDNFYDSNHGCRPWD